jgi:hypothetical protein
VATEAYKRQRKCIKAVHKNRNIKGRLFAFINKSRNMWNSGLVKSPYNTARAKACSGSFFKKRPNSKAKIDNYAAKTLIYKKGNFRPYKEATSGPGLQH